MSDRQSRATCHLRDPHLSAPSIYTTCQFPAPRVQSSASDRPGRCHGCVDPCQRVNCCDCLGRDTKRARVKPASPGKSCRRLHKRSSRLGRGRRGKRFFTAGWPRWTVALVDRLSGLLQGCLQRKCLPCSRMLCKGMAHLPLCALYTWLFLGEGGERTHWHGELMASRGNGVETQDFGPAFGRSRFHASVLL